jgi:hypothetical protein
MSSRYVFRRAVALATLSMFSLQAFALQANIVVNRAGTDRYVVVKGDNMKPNEVEIQTKYCHAYPYNEEAIIVAGEDINNETAMILFASGDQCEVVAVKNKSKSDFSLLDFLIQLGIAYLTKGKVQPVTAKPKPQ